MQEAISAQQRHSDLGRWRTTCRLLKKTVSKAAASEDPKAYPLGYVEGLNDARTQLAVFFSSPPKLGESVWEGRHMHLKFAPRRIVGITTQGILHHRECDLVPRNFREGEQLHFEAFLAYPEIL